MAEMAAFDLQMRKVPALAQLHHENVGVYYLVLEVLWATERRLKAVAKHLPDPSTVALVKNFGARRHQQARTLRGPALERDPKLN